MESRIVSLAIILGTFLLASCHPEHDSYLLNSTSQVAVLSYGGKVIKVLPGKQIAYDEIKDAHKLILQINRSNVDLGKSLKEISLKYHKKTSIAVGEPHQLLVQIKKDGFIYLGFQTLRGQRFGLFKEQPEGFPIKWKR